MISEKYKTTCKYLNYVKHLLILASTVTSCVSISVFASLVFVVILNTILNTIEILISKALIDSYFSHGKFVSVNIVLKEHNGIKEMKEEIKFFFNILYKNNGKVLRQL